VLLLLLVLMGRLRESWIVTFLRMPDRSGVALRLLFGSNLLSRLLEVVGRLRRTRSGSGDGDFVLSSSGRLVSRSLGGTAGRGIDASARTGADSKAASSELLLSDGLCRLTVSSVSISSVSELLDDGADSTWLLAPSVNLWAESTLETGGPGGSSKAVTAVQLSARSLFIIQ